MELELGGKVAIVTGGSGGIGKAIALELAREGVDIAIAARSSENVDLTATAIAAETGQRVIGIPTDTTNWDDVQRMVSTTIAELGSVDILVNSAAMVGGQVRGSLEEAREEDLTEDLDTKVVGYFRCIKAVAPHMRAQKWGRIISIGGLSARSATIYGLRNAAVVHMTKTLSDQLGADGITLNVVHPGLTLTAAVAQRLESQARKPGQSRSAAYRSASESVAIGRIVNPRELAWLTAYLASPKAECITGEAIAAGGGAKGSVHQ